MIMIIATFAQALSGQAPSVNVIGALVVWRFIVRIWVGLGQRIKLILCVSDGRRNWWRLSFEFRYLFRIRSNQNPW